MDCTKLYLINFNIKKDYRKARKYIFVASRVVLFMVCLESHKEEQLIIEWRITSCPALTRYMIMHIGFDSQ